MCLQIFRALHRCVIIGMTNVRVLKVYTIVYIYMLWYVLYGDMTHVPEPREMQVGLLIFTQVLSCVYRKLIFCLLTFPTFI